MFLLQVTNNNVGLIYANIYPFHLSKVMKKLHVFEYEYRALIFSRVLYLYIVKSNQRKQSSSIHYHYSYPLHTE